MRIHSLQSITVGAFSYLALAVPTIATANDLFADHVTTAQKTVSLAQYDLATPRGLVLARERIARETQRLCREVGDTRKVDDREAQIVCFSEAYENATQRLSRIAAFATARVQIASKRVGSK